LPPDARARHLADFEVFGGARVCEWLSLEQLAQMPTTGRGVEQSEVPCEPDNEPVPDAARAGAVRLRRLQREVIEQLPCVKALVQPVCMFHQLQMLERGVSIEAHIDAPTPPADVVATLSLGGGASERVRVGHVQINLSAGDMYAISGAARWDVSHEVLASTSDRLSLTLRFARESCL
jgi:hypothetical protein